MLHYRSIYCYCFNSSVYHCLLNGNLHYFHTISFITEVSTQFVCLIYYIGVLMKENEALSVLSGFSYRYNLGGGYAVLPARIEHTILQNNAELREALILVNSLVPEVDSTFEIGNHVLTRKTTKAGQLLFHWGNPTTDNIPNADEVKELLGF